MGRRLKARTTTVDFIIRRDTMGPVPCAGLSDRPRGPMKRVSLGVLGALVPIVLLGGYVVRMLAGNVRFASGLTDDELVALMGSAEVACVPSLYEGFSLPTAELMACETPLVASRAGLLRDGELLPGPRRPAGARPSGR